MPRKKPSQVRALFIVADLDNLEDIVQILTVPEALIAEEVFDNWKHTRISQGFNSDETRMTAEELEQLKFYTAEMPPETLQIARDQRTISRFNAYGAKTWGSAWLRVNQIMVENSWGTNIDIEDLETKKTYMKIANRLLHFLRPIKQEAPNEASPSK